MQIEMGGKRRALTFSCLFRLLLHGLLSKAPCRENLKVVGRSVTAALATVKHPPYFHQNRTAIGPVAVGKVGMAPPWPRLKELECGIGRSSPAWHAQTTGLLVRRVTHFVTFGWSDFTHTLYTYVHYIQDFMMYNYLACHFETLCKHQAGGAPSECQRQRGG